MSRARVVRSLAAVGAVGVIVTNLTACSIGKHSCSDFNDAYKSAGSPEVVETVRDAYFSEHDDKDSVSFGQIGALISTVYEGCKANPDANVEDFV